MSLIKKITFNRNNQHGFPYDLSFFNETISLENVNIIVGENGSGKSTFLELLSQKLNLYQIGTPLILPKAVDIDITFRLNKPKGFYFSSEDFTSYIQQLKTQKEEAKNRLKEIDIEYNDKSLFSKQQAKSAYLKTIFEINNLYQKDLLTSSHGEAYLSFFKSRIKPNQLYVLDEPETPLSFDNQLALMYLIHEAIKDGSQFIIATHSPVLCAFPDAKIFELTHEQLLQTPYESLTHIQSLKDFLNDPKRFFHQLFK